VWARHTYKAYSYLQQQKFNNTPLPSETNNSTLLESTQHDRDTEIIDQNDLGEGENKFNSPNKK
jgi:hypothetical protein